MKSKIDIQGLTHLDEIRGKSEPCRELYWIGTANKRRAFNKVDRQMRKSYIQKEIDVHIHILKSLHTPKGLFLAAPADASTGYDKAWLRDNFYISLAFERIGDWKMVHDIFDAIMQIFCKHKDKIDWAIENKPHESWQYIHARYNPETLEEYWEEWGNKQNDAVGSMVYQIGRLEEEGYSVLHTDAEKKMLQLLVDYLCNVEFWHDADSGMWEAGLDIRASSVGAALAGLKKVEHLPFIAVKDGVLEKALNALRELLPRESKIKFTDLALLSLIYPYNIVSGDVAREIVWNLEYHLERNLGIIRYRNDEYYNKNADGYSEEAEWTFGLPWLAIIYKRLGDNERAKQYMNKAIQTKTKEGTIPELYFSHTDKPNENNPLGWSESMYVVALKELESIW